VGADVCIAHADFTKQKVWAVSSIGASLVASRRSRGRSSAAVLDMKAH
jgi:hypothetical protein